MTAQHDGKVRLYSFLDWKPLPKSFDDVKIDIVRSTVKWPRLLADTELALRLWFRSLRPSSVGLVDMNRATLLFCLFRSILPTRGRVILYNLFFQRDHRLRMAVLRRAMGAATVCVPWSDRQGDRCSEALGLPRQRFITVRYKSNRSKFPRVEKLALGDYVFSGGDSARDYRTLFEAVRNLDIPVVVSTTDAAPTHGCIMPETVPENVLLIQALEPHFARLMASARLVVVPLTAGRLRGAGEATMLDAMWHGRPVICADDVSAPEYIENGVDGIVVPPGDPAELRKAILSLWHDRESAEAMGQAGMRKVEAQFTHECFVARLFEVAGVVRHRR